jgi:lipopolysaccharide export system permease protein
MTILDRYIGRTIVGSSVTVLLVLVAIFTFFSFIDQIDDLNHVGYGLPQVALVALLGIPYLTYELLPMASLLGSLLSLGVLANHSELAVMRAAGIPVARTTWSVLMGGGVLVVFGAAVGEFVVPTSDNMALQIRALSGKQIRDARRLHGFWTREEDDYVHIERILPEDSVEQVHIYRIGANNQLRSTIRAARGHYSEGKWVLEDVAITHLDADGVRAEHLARMAWSSQMKPRLLNLVAQKPDRLSLWDLVGYLNFLHQNGQQSDHHSQALWLKIVYPFSTWVMVFLAVPLVLRDLQPVSTGRRVLLGALVGLGFHLTNQTLGHLGLVLKLNPAVAVLSPTLVTMALGVLLLRRV